MDWNDIEMKPRPPWGGGRKVEEGVEVGLLSFSSPHMLRRLGFALGWGPGSGRGEGLERGKEEEEGCERVEESGKCDVCRYEKGRREEGRPDC